MKDKHEVLLSSDNTGLDIKYKSILSPFNQGNSKYLIEILTFFCHPVISGIFTFLWQGDDEVFFLIRLYVLVVCFPNGHMLVSILSQIKLFKPSHEMFILLGISRFGTQ